jgi:hypothetical protein
MASKSKSDAARENGKTSRGPKTLEGRKSSSQNALKHGLTAESHVLPGESEQDFLELLRAHESTYHPANAIEKDLVDTMALARWRLRRLATLETSLLETGLALSKEDIDERFDDVSDQSRMAFAFNEQTKSLALLMRYEASLTRLHDRTYKHLKELQKLRNEPTNPEPPCVSMRTDEPAHDNDDPSPMRQGGAIPVMPEKAPEPSAPCDHGSLDRSRITSSSTPSSSSPL